MKLSKLFFFYNAKVEDLCTRILYFFNTLDTYFILSGVLSFLILTKGQIESYPYVLLTAGFFILWFRIADFHPWFMLYSLPAVWVVGLLCGGYVVPVLISNAIIFIVVQFVFMGIPDSIVGRDPRIAFYKIYHSFYTLAPTTVSFPVSIFFSSFLALGLSANGTFTVQSFLAIQGWLGLAAILARFARPKNEMPQFEKYPTQKKYVDRVVLL
ncbi:MAG: hypothetical protein HY537_16395, partial [Deltaproteobacteria bacterium]|nr:hypothetical protein [Deltaproteobacteria bacterium]